MILEHPENAGGDAVNPASIVIVGSGVAGLFLAKCLLSQGADSVTVIEGGGEALGAFSQESFEVIGRSHDGIRIGRSRALGGTSNLWGGQLVEFSQLDFERRDWVQNSGWPIGLADLQPFYARAFELAGIGADWTTDAPIWKAVVGEVPEVGPSLEVFLTRWMNVPSLARMLREDIRHSPRMRVLLNHTVNGFEFSAKGVSRIRMRNPEGRDVMMPVGTLVIAAGTVETARLMLTGALDSACPWRGNPMLGRRFQDHLGGRIATIRPRDRKALDRIFTTIHWRGHKFQPKVRLSDRTIRQRKSLGALGMVAFESSVSEHLHFLKQFLKAALHSREIRGARDFVVHAAACARYLPPLMLAYLKDHRVMFPANASISLIVQAEQVPVDESCIRIVPSERDALGLPKVELDWRLGGAELESIRALAIECRGAFAAAGLGDVLIDERLMSLDPSMLASFRDTNHPAGGCVMAEGPDSGVVDPSLRVFGTDNVYVLGASTFPTSSDANVTFTAMAFACRLADHLLARNT